MSHLSRATFASILTLILAATPAFGQDDDPHIALKLRLARQHQAEGNDAAALRLVEEVLFIDEDHHSAHALLVMLDGDPSRSPSDRKAARRLDEAWIPVDFDNRVEDVIAFLTQVTNVPMYVDWDALQTTGVGRDDPVSLKIEKARATTVLDAVLRHVEGDGGRLGWMVQDGMVVVSTAARLRERTKTVVYDVRDLLEFGDPDEARRREMLEQLTTIIQENVDPEGWVDLGGDRNDLRELNGNLVITTRPWVQRAIADLLSQLRELRRAPGEPPVAPRLDEPDEVCRLLRIADRRLWPLLVAQVPSRIPPPEGVMVVRGQLVLRLRLSRLDDTVEAELRRLGLTVETRLETTGQVIGRADREALPAIAAHEAIEHLEPLDE